MSVPDRPPVPAGSPEAGERPIHVVHLPSGRRGWVLWQGSDNEAIWWGGRSTSSVDADDLRELAPAPEIVRLHLCRECGAHWDRDDLGIDLACPNGCGQTSRVEYVEASSSSPDRVRPSSPDLDAAVEAGASVLGAFGTEATDKRRADARRVIEAALPHLAPSLTAEEARLAADLIDAATARDGQTVAVRALVAKLSALAEGSGGSDE
jgi:predicted  nucleic acid-binding Zn-ribbon protein